MKVIIPASHASKLKENLLKAKSREIGGQLFGEQMMPSQFLIKDIAYQKKVGAFARFIVDIVQAAHDAAKFFSNTNHKYVRYNYLGEWHSHPSFSICPSHTDIDTMLSLVKDVSFKGNFAILLIVKLEKGQLLCGAWLFDPLKDFLQPVELEIEI